MLFSIWTKHTTKDLVITSICDGSHGTRSLHWSGNAADFRTKEVVYATVRKIFLEARELMDWHDFDIVFEFEGTDNEHIHLEYQPKASTLTTEMLHE